MRLSSCSLLLWAVLGCASRQSSANLGESRELPPEPEVKEAHGKPPVSRLPRDVVARAAMPFFGIRADGTRLEPERLLRELSGADLICVGEQHDNPHHHWAELRVLRGLLAHAPMRGREIAVGLEMIQLPFQKVVDDYLQWEIEEEELLEGVEWHERWGFDWGYYRPVVELARRARLRVIALNTPRELTRRASSEGLDALEDDDSVELPEVDLDDEEHRAWFDEATHGHPTPAADKDRMYEAQVLWDETMADTAAKYLRGHVPMRQLIVLAGSGHCRDRAIPARLRRRIPVEVASVHPVIQSAEADPSQALEGFDYAFVMTPPD